MEMKAVRKRMSPRERTKRTRWWKLNQEELKDALISKAREHLCSLEAEGKETDIEVVGESSRKQIEKNGEHQ